MPFALGSPVSGVRMAGQRRCQETCPSSPFPPFPSSLPLQVRTHIDKKSYSRIKKAREAGSQPAPPLGAGGFGECVRLSKLAVLLTTAGLEGHAGYQLDRTAV